MPPTEPPTVGEQIEALVRDALDALARAEIAAVGAEDACIRVAAACTAASQAREAVSRAETALTEARAATTLEEAERAATTALVAAGDAIDAAETAVRLAAEHGPTEPDPTESFTLAAGTERELAAGSFLVCPQGGAACEIVSVTEDANGEFVVELAESSGPAFIWSSGAGLFSALLTSYEQVTVRLVGSDTTHLVTCGQAAPCDVSELRINDQGAIVWSGTSRVHVTLDETGFFLVGERTVTFPDGRTARFTCPTGCGVSRVYLDADGTPTWIWDDAWHAPEVVFLDEDSEEIDEGTENGTGTGDGTGTGTDPTPPRQMTPPEPTSSYTGLPAELTKFEVDHWEMADEIPWFTLNPDTDQWEEVMQPEVVCPGVHPDGNECEIRGKWRHVSEILEAMQGNISVTSNRDKYGYATFAPDREKLQAIHDKLLMQQPLTQADIEFLGYNSFGWWGTHSAFGQLSIYHGAESEPDVSLHHFAFGHLYYPETGGKPTPDQGSGTWRGPMVGMWHIPDTVVASAFNGTSKLEYDFVNDDLDLTLEIEHAEPVNSAAVRDAIESLPPDIRDQAGLNQIGSEIHYQGRMEIKWRDVKQNNDGSFFISGNHKENTHPDPDFGILDGDFYGPNAEEFAGYFERTMDGYDLRGVFGGKREKDNQ